MPTYIDEDHKKQRQLEKEFVDEAGQKYDDLIAFFVLIAFQERTSKAQKLKMIAEKVRQYRDFNASFSKRAVERAYMVGKNIAYSDLSKPIKKITNAQRAEMEALVGQLRADLDSRLGTYEQNGKKLVLKVDLAKLREEALGFTDATEQRFIDRRKKTKEILFLDSRGRRISNKAIMSVGAGDILWDTMASAERSIYLQEGITKAMHISVIDDRTSDICLALHESIRDLRRDKIPPMHPNCRSKIIAINPETGQPFGI